MGLFSRVRRLNGSPSPVPDEASPSPAEDEAAAAEAADTVPPLQIAPPPPTGPTPRHGSASINALRESLQQLYSIRPSRDAFAAEAVKLIAKGAGVQAAALLGYEARGGRIRLLAHTGLGHDAVQTLAGDTMVSAWDIPLRALRNRRINVIESAHENPFVPRPLIAISPRRLSIAALPFFHANGPIGVIVLFSPTQRGFADGLLKALSQSLRVCAMALSELPSPAATAAAARGGSEEATPQPNLLRGLAALKAELARLTDALEDTERQRANEVAERVSAQTFLKAAQERTAHLESELAELRAAQGRLPELEGELQRTAERLTAAMEAGDAARAEVAQLQTSLAEHSQRAEQHAAAIAELSERRQQLETQLQTALDTARQRGEEAAALHAQVAELAPRATQAAELQTALAGVEAARAEADAVTVRLRQELREAQDRCGRADSQHQQSASALKASEAERTALAKQLEEAQRQVAELAATQKQLATLREQLKTLEAEHGAHRQELEATRTALGADGQQLAASAQRAATRMAELDAERTRLGTELDTVRKRADDAGAEAKRHAEALAALQKELAAERAALKEASQARTALEQRAASLERDVTSIRTTAADLESRLAERHRAAEQLSTERNELVARVEALAAGGQSLQQERHAAIAAAQQHGAELEAEIARLGAALEATRSSATEELNRTRHDAGATLDALRVELAEAARGRDELQRALAAAQHESATQQRALADLAAERTKLEAAAERLNAERRDLSARIDSAAGDHTTLQRRHEEAAKRIAELEAEVHELRDRQLSRAETQLTLEREARAAAEDALATAETRHRDEVAELRDRLAAVDHEQARLSRELEEKALLLESAEHDLTATIELSAEAIEDEDSVLDIDRDCAPVAAEGGESGDSEVLAEVEAAAGGDCILLDANAMAASAVRELAGFGHRVTGIEPTADASDSLKERSVTCAAVNLAAPQAWSLVRHLRNGSGIPRMPLIAYALAENAPKGFWLGPVDFAVMPVGKSDLTDMLNRMVPKLKRVIAMSNDIDVMSDVRTQLTEAGISTAVVLDGRQALDLVPTIRPEAAVLHLSPACADVFRAIAGLRSQEISRDIPIVFLLDTDAHPREDAFLTAGLRMLAGRGTLAPEGLVESLASAFDGYR